MSINHKIIAEGIHYCIKNAERFFNSALLLKDSDKNSAYLLSLHCLEEFGKIILISNVLYYQDNPKKWDGWKRRFKNHGEKFWFSKDIDDILQKKMVKESNAQYINVAQKKLAITYVDFNEQKFNYPQTITDEEIDDSLKTCGKRLEFLKKNHPSIEIDAERILTSYEELNGLTLSELKTRAKRIDFDN